MKTGCRWGGVLLGALVFLAMSLGAVAEKKMAALVSTDGKTINAEVLEKGEDRVKVRMKSKIYTLPFAKLSKESVELVKGLDVPTICDFRLEADFTKRSSEVSKDRREAYKDSDGLTQYMTVSDSYRVDSITGVIKVENRDVKEASPAAKLYVVVLCRAKSGTKVIRKEVFDLKAIEPLSDAEFPVAKARTWHTERGLPIGKPKGVVGGRYSGYIAAVVIDGRIAEMETMPSSLERDADEVRRLLNLDREEKKEGK